MILLSFENAKFIDLDHSTSLFLCLFIKILGFVFDLKTADELSFLVKINFVITVFLESKIVFITAFFLLTKISKIILWKLIPQESLNVEAVNEGVL